MTKKGFKHHGIEFLELVRKMYPLLGAKEMIQKYSLKMTPHNLASYASRNKINISIEGKSLINTNLSKRVFSEEGRKKIALSSTKYNYILLKEKIINDYELYRSARKVAMLNNLNEYAVKKVLTLWGYILVKNPKYSIFNSTDIQFIIRYKDELTLQEMGARIHKTPKQIVRQLKLLGISRDWRTLQKRKTTEFNFRDNPSKRYEVRIAASIRMKKNILENKCVLLNRLMRRNKMTSLEKRVKYILDKHNISYLYNKYVKTNISYKFPDFRVDNIIFECDGNRFHSNSEKDILRDIELIDVGYTVYHFTENEINKNIDEVERCILCALKV